MYTIDCESLWKKIVEIFNEWYYPGSSDCAKCKKKH